MALSIKLNAARKVEQITDKAQEAKTGQLWFSAGKGKAHPSDEVVGQLSPQDQHFLGMEAALIRLVRPRPCLVLLHFPTPHILPILDHAPWHFGPEIRQLLTKNDRLELMCFPVACPDLNPQEHVWEHTRDAISHNHSYRSFEPLLADFETFLNEMLFACDFIEQYGPPINTAILN